MTGSLRRILVFACVALLVQSVAFTEQTPFPGLTRSVLENGLEVFVYEDHVVPLVRVQITFRCGSITQTPETAGLFHLYEHMLFKGNKVFTSDSQFQAAMKELGVASWNGGTSTEYVTYYFAVPSGKTEKGLEFWANAVRYPLFKADELETEKDVVVNEVLGYLNEPDQIYSSAVSRALYYKYPWRRDIGGWEQSIRNATVETMRRIQDTYYVPNNAALFVGGDVDPVEVMELVEKHFDDWQGGGQPWLDVPPPHPFMDEDSYMAYGDESMYPNFGFVNIKMRGPDVLADPKATYAADVLLTLMEDSTGRFKTSIFNKTPGLYSKEYIAFYYMTQRDGGYIDFSTYVVLQPDMNTFDRVKALHTAFMQEVQTMAETPDYYSQEDFDVVKVKLQDQLLIDMETPSAFINTLSFWWASADTDYYFNYIDNLNRISHDDLRQFINDYLLTNKAVVSLRINTMNLQQEQSNFEVSGFQEITKEDAYWWKDSDGGAQ